MINEMMALLALQEENKNKKAMLENSTSYEKDLLDKENKREKYEEMMMYSPMAMQMAMEEDTKFRSELKKDLLTEAIGIIFNKAAYFPLYKPANILKEHLVSSYVNEKGATTLLNEFATKTYLLSEMTRIVNEYVEVISEKASKVKDKVIDPYDKENFYTDIANIADLDYAQAAIKTRVSMAINQFNSDNLEKKKEIENIMNVTRAKLNNNIKDSIKKLEEQKAYEEEYQYNVGTVNTDDQEQGYLNKILIDEIAQQITRQISANRLPKAAAQ